MLPAGGQGVSAPTLHAYLLIFLIAAGAALAALAAALCLPSGRPTRSAPSGLSAPGVPTGTAGLTKSAPAHRETT